MSLIINLFSQVLINNGRRKKKDDNEYPLLSQTTGKALNPLYRPRAKKKDFDECDRLIDQDMKALGYRKYLAGDAIPRPKRRFLRKSERMQVGDVKTMARVGKFKK